LTKDFFSVQWKYQTMAVDVQELIGDNYRCRQTFMIEDRLKAEEVELIGEAV
jgi:hypothetical protein